MVDESFALIVLAYTDLDPDAFVVIFCILPFNFDKSIIYVKSDPCAVIVHALFVEHAAYLDDNIMSS